MLANEEWVRRKYEELTPLFGGDMPDISVRINKTLHKFGEATCTIYADDNDDSIHAGDFIITISNAYDSPEDVKVNILLHEMIHIYDYYNFPEHFAKIVGGNLVARRKGEYNSHGNVLFIPMMNKINSHGFNVNTYVADSEIERSTMSDDVKKRMEKPFCLCYAEYTNAENNMMFICSEVTLDNIRKRYSTFEWNRFAPDILSVYNTTNVSLKKSLSMTKGDSIRGYRMSYDKWYGLLNELGISDRKPDKILYLKKEKMNENKGRKKIIRLTESELKRMVSEALEEIMTEEGTEPVDGGNAVPKQLSHKSISFSVV